MPLVELLLMDVVVYSSILVILLQRPEGIIPEKPTFTLRREKLLSIIGGDVKKGVGKEEDS
jgi:hypothetical protein